MILFDQVSKKFADKAIFENLNLQIEDGDFICLQGPSGAGKTTLVHALIGFMKISAGKIMVDQFTVSSLSSSAMQVYRRNIGVVFQDYKLLPQKTVFENVAFALEVCDKTELQISRRVNKLLREVGLEEHKKHFPRELSGGEKQRVAIARALAHNPRLLIADEPTGNLDPENAAQIIELLVRINLQGTTVLLTTHNNNLLKLIPRCRLLTLNKGRIIKDRLISN